MLGAVTTCPFLSVVLLFPWPSHRHLLYIVSGQSQVVLASLAASSFCRLTRCPPPHLTHVQWPWDTSMQDVFKE